jgi:hypothetical protein
MIQGYLPDAVLIAYCCSGTPHVLPSSYLKEFSLGDARQRKSHQNFKSAIFGELIISPFDFIRTTFSEK